MKQRNITPYNIKKKIVPARKMVGKIARVKIKMVISLVKLSFLFNSEITVFHRYLYNKRFYGAEYNNIEFGFASFNIVILCSIKPWKYWSRSSAVIVSYSKLSWTTTGRESDNDKLNTFHNSQFNKHSVTHNLTL